MVSVNDVTPPTGMEDAPNVNEPDGGATTARVADALLPVPPSFELTALVVFVFSPAAVAVTFTEKVHDALAASVPPLRLTAFDPAVAEIVPVPHDPERPLGVATARPAGNVSLAPMLLRLVPLGFVMVKLREVEPFRGMLAAPKAMASA
jgi:hypothetical protein